MPSIEILGTGFNKLRIGREECGFQAFIWKGEPGPVAVVNGATHGDEYEAPAR